MATGTAHTTPAPEGFDAALAAVDGVEGWMTDAQARRLFEAGARVPSGGRIVEIGSFRGRSTIILALAGPGGRRGRRGRPARRRRPRPAGDHPRRAARRGGLPDLPRQPRPRRRPGSRPPRAAALRGGARRGGDALRPPLRRRCAPLRAGPRRHRPLRRERPRGRDAAHPRLVQRERGHAGPAPPPLHLRAVPVRRALGLAGRVPPRGARARRPGAQRGRAGRPGPPTGCATPSSRSPSWPVARAWPAASATTPGTGPTSRGAGPRGWPRPPRRRRSRPGRGGWHRSGDARAWRSRRSTRCCRSRCSCPAWSRAGRCRPRTTCGPRRRGPRAGRRASRSSGRTASRPTR